MVKNCIVPLEDRLFAEVSSTVLNASQLYIKARKTPHGQLCVEWVLWSCSYWLPWVLVSQGKPHHQIIYKKQSILTDKEDATSFSYDILPPCPFPVMMTPKPFTVHVVIMGRKHIYQNSLHAFWGGWRWGAARQLGRCSDLTPTLPGFASSPVSGGRWVAGSSVISTCYFGQLHKRYPWQFWIACINHLMAAGLVAALSSFSQLFFPFWVSHISSSLLYPT